MNMERHDYTHTTHTINNSHKFWAVVVRQPRKMKRSWKITVSNGRLSKKDERRKFSARTRYISLRR